MSQNMIKGWKGAAKYLSVTDRTLRRWHYEWLKIPWMKDTRANQGRLRIQPGILELWYHELRVLRSDVNGRDG